MSKNVNIVYTLGHSSRTLEELIKILKHYNIEVVIDVRRFPKSRKFPHFNREVLEQALREHAIEYVWIEKLGGYRKFGVDVPHIEKYAICFESEGFRAYAAYITLNSEVKKVLQELIEKYLSRRVCALLCSEKLYVRCHRKIIADYLVAKGFQVLHIYDLGRVQPHRLSRCAKIANGELTYE